METANEVKAIQDLAKEVKGEVANVETKLNNSLETVQKSVDALTAKVEKAAIGAAATETETKNPLLAAIESKSADIANLATLKSMSITLDKKAADTMLRAAAGAFKTPAQNVGFLAPLPIPTDVRDVLAGGTTNSDTITYLRETGFQGGAEMVGEGALKPAMSLSTESVSATVKKIAVRYKVSEETTKDAPQFTSYLSSRAQDDIKRQETAQLMYGDGTGQNLQGIYPLATAFTGAGKKVKNAQKIDVLRLAVAQIRKNKGRANAILMAPGDVAEMELTKDANGNYLLPTVYTGSLPSVGKVQIIEIDAMVEGTFLVGSFDKGAQLFDREGVTIRLYDQSEDDALHNLILVVLECRLVQAVYRPELFVKGTFADAITLINQA